MATNTENLTARRDAIYAELAALDSTKAGGKPNTSGAGATVDHVGYKKSLYDELKQINELISAADGAVEVISYGC